jgi:magnesium chelatase family protein
MTPRMLREHARLADRDERLLKDACARGMVSARGESRVLRVARTIADLAGRERIGRGELSEAIGLRLDVASVERRR